MTQTEPRGGSDRSSSAAPAWLAWAAIGLAVLPLVVAAIRAIHQGWIPMGDNAYFTIRARDVLTHDNPLIGAWSSGSQSVGRPVNNLGPLRLDLLAPFAKVSPGAGTVVGVTFANVASVVGLGLVARRVAGPVAVVLTMAATSMVTWVMGSDLLLEVRQHYALMLPFLCLLGLCWAVAVGHVRLLPWLAFVASYIVQDHLSYALLVALPLLWSVTEAVRVHWRTPGGSTGSPWWRPLVRPGVISAVVLAVCWAQPVYDQLFGTQNLSRLHGAVGGGEPAGATLGVRLAASVVGVPTHWGRGGFGGFTIDRDWVLLDLVPSVAVLLVLGVLLLVGWVAATRRGDRPGAVAVQAAAVTMVAALITATRMPGGAFGVTGFNYRWLWPVTAFVLLALVLGLVGTGAGSRTPSPARGRAVAWVAGVVLVGLTAANLPAASVNEPTTWEHALMPTARALLDQLADAEVEGPVLFDRTGTLFGEPYSYPVLLELQRRGIDFTTADPGDILRFGSGRRERGQARQRLRIRVGEPARQEVPGARRVASVCPDGPIEDQLTCVSLFLEPVAAG